MPGGDRVYGDRGLNMARPDTGGQCLEHRVVATGSEREDAAARSAMMLGYPPGREAASASPANLQYQARAVINLVRNHTCYALCPMFASHAR